MNWWADFGGLLGRGASWTVADYVVLIVSFPLAVVLAAYLGNVLASAWPRTCLTMKD
jgi:hypothetical protein